MPHQSHHILNRIILDKDWIPKRPPHRIYHPLQPYEHPPVLCLHLQQQITLEVDHLQLLDHHPSQKIHFLV